MISSISSTDYYIHLYNDDYFSFNFFDVDSISLLIGKNGSGKTRLLQKIATRVTHPNSMSYGEDLRVGYIGDERESKKGWGCIYFSPIKNDFGFNSRKTFFENASSSFNKKVSFEEVMDSRSLFDSFSIHPRLAAVAENPIKPLLRAFIELALKYGKEDNKNFRYFYNFDSFKLLYDFKSKKESLYLNEKDAYRKESILFTELIHDVINDLSKNIKIERVLAFFIMLNKAINYRIEDNIHHCFDKFIDFIKMVKGEDFHYFDGDEIKKIELFIESRLWAVTTNPYEDIFIPLNYPQDMEVLREFEVDEYFNIELMNMSSGQLAIINQVLSIQRSITRLNAKKVKKILVLIDEGDAFLHLDWQQSYIFHINNFLGFLKVKYEILVLQVIIATHSPLLATDLPKGFICRLEGKDEVDMAFASPMHLLLHNSFGSKSIGKFASSKINSAVENLRDGVATHIDIQIIKAIDNEVLKKEIFRLYGEDLFL